MQFECVDEWTPGTCTEAAMNTYKAAEADGVIKVQHVDVGRLTGKVIVRYLSDRSHEGALVRLAELKRQLERAR